MFYTFPSMSSKVISLISSTSSHPLLAAFLNMIHMNSLDKYLCSRLWAVVSAAQKATGWNRALDLLFFRLSLCKLCAQTAQFHSPVFEMTSRAGCDRVKKKRRKNFKYMLTTITFSCVLLSVLRLRAKRLECQETECLAQRYFASVRR